MDELEQKKKNYLKKDLVLVLLLTFFILAIVVGMAIIDAQNDYLSNWAHNLMESIVGQ